MLWNTILLSKGDAPIEEELQVRLHGMRAGFHHDELPFRQTLELIRAQQRTLHHLEGLAALLSLADRTGEDRACPKRFGKHLGGLAAGCKAAEDSRLAVVLYDRRAFLAVVLFELGKTLDDRHQRQPAGAACGEKRKDIERRHRSKLIHEEDNAPREFASILISDIEKFLAECLHHKGCHEVLGDILLRKN